MSRAPQHSAMAGIVLAFLLSVPVVMLWAGLGGSIAVPFSGWVKGWNAVESSVGFVVVYGLLGGFPILAIAGALAGLLVQRIWETERVAWFRILVACVLIDFLLFVCLLACAQAWT